MIIKNLDGEILYADRAAEEMFEDNLRLINHTMFDPGTKPEEGMEIEISRGEQVFEYGDDRVRATISMAWPHCMTFQKRMHRNLFGPRIPPYMAPRT